MDAIDQKIISILQENARTPLKSIAEQVFLSSPAVSARIERMERDKIIAGYGVKVDQAQLGYQIAAFIHLEMLPTQKDEFYEFIEECHNVLECDCVTGDFSILMKVAFPDTNELEKFVDSIQQFGRTNTQIVLSTPVEARGLHMS